DDFLDASASTLGIVAFGGDGADAIVGGSGNDALFGDRGVVDYYGANGKLVTRLGIGTGEASTDPASPLYVPDRQTDGGPNEQPVYATRVSRGGGNDILIGGLGSDRMWGEEGNDLLLGGLGSVQRTYGANGALVRTDVLLLESASVTGSIALEGRASPGADLA